MGPGNGGSRPRTTHDLTPSLRKCCNGWIVNGTRCTRGGQTRGWDRHQDRCSPTGRHKPSLDPSCLWISGVGMGSRLVLALPATSCPACTTSSSGTPLCAPCRMVVRPACVHAGHRAGCCNCDSVQNWAPCLPGSHSLLESGLALSPPGWLRGSEW